MKLLFLFPPLSRARPPLKVNPLEAVAWLLLFPDHSDHYRDLLDLRDGWSIALFFRAFAVSLRYGHDGWDRHEQEPEESPPDRPSD